MNKLRTKRLWLAEALPTPPYEVLTKETRLRAVAKKLGLPLMVKPVNEGSSIGMSKVVVAAALEEAYALAVNYDPVVIAEKFVDGTELTVGILGEQVLPIIKLETPRDFYDYDAKYIADDTRYLIPCGLSEKKEKEVQTLCMKAFRTLGCEGWLDAQPAGAPVPAGNEHCARHDRPFAGAHGGARGRPVLSGLVPAHPGACPCGITLAS